MKRHLEWIALWALSACAEGRKPLDGGQDAAPRADARLDQRVNLDAAGDAQPDASRDAILDQALDAAIALDARPRDAGAEDGPLFCRDDAGDGNCPPELGVCMGVGRCCDTHYCLNCIVDAHCARFCVGGVCSACRGPADCPAERPVCAAIEEWGGVYACHECAGLEGECDGRECIDGECAPE